MTSRSPDSSAKVVEPNVAGLGTFGGVFTPSILTILGVIMYLRFGWVVGQMGLVKTLLIVTISTSITFITGLSISAIATDQVIERPVIKVIEVEMVFLSARSQPIRWSGPGEPTT